MEQFKDCAEHKYIKSRCAYFLKLIDIESIQTSYQYTRNPGMEGKYNTRSPGKLTFPFKIDKIVYNFVMIVIASELL